MNATYTPLFDPAIMRVSRLVLAPRERVYGAWIDADIRRKWWTNGSSGRPSICEIGEFVEQVAPDRLVFRCKAKHNSTTTSNRLVTVELREVPEGTYVIVSHEGIDSPGLREETDDGWARLVDNMATVLTQT